MTRWGYALIGEPLIVCECSTNDLLHAREVMPSSLLPDTLLDLNVADLTFGSQNWDRRRSSETKQTSITFLEDAANYLIADQMRPERIYWSGAADAVHLLRQAICAIRAERRLEERAARVVASWLPKYTLARNARWGESDA